MIYSMERTLLTALVLAAVLLPAAAQAGDRIDLDGIVAKFGWDFETTEIKAQKIGDGLHVLFGLGGNIAVSSGDQGVLLVDDQFPQLMPRIEQKIRELGGGKVDFVINTHWHFDHSDGNRSLGPQGTWIVSQSNSRLKMEQDSLVNLVQVGVYEQSAMGRDALPVISFDDRMQFHFNGETIDLFHPGPAHTAGDAAVIFRKHNAVHLGDVFNNTGYPFIDADSGGEIDGMIAFCRAVLAEIPRDATVIPGHGEVTDVPALEHYVQMLQTVRDRVAAMVDAGKSLEEVVASDPTADFTDRYGDVAESIGFVDRVYTSLAKKKTR
jgi:cyclase